MSLTGTLQLIPHKKDTLTGSLAGLNYPPLDTQDEWVLHGFSFANYLEELGPAVKAPPAFPGLSRGMESQRDHAGDDGSAHWHAISSAPIL
jgi:hypothetical protein